MDTYYIALIVFFSSVLLIYYLAQRLKLRIDEIRKLKSTLNHCGLEKKELVEHLSLTKKNLQDLSDQLVRIESVHDYEVATKSLQSIEAFRRQMGAELHDHVSGLLFATKNHIEVAAMADAKTTDPNLQKAIQLISNVQEYVRNMMDGLLIKNLEKDGFSKTLEQHCIKISTEQMDFAFNEMDKHDMWILRDEVQTFRVVQEILNNCLKHSNAKTIVVTVSWGLWVYISIVNDGTAFNMNEQFLNRNSNVGLQSIYDRISLLGGNVRCKAGPPNTVLIELPTQSVNDERYSRLYRR